MKRGKGVGEGGTGPEGERGGRMREKVGGKGPESALEKL